MAQLARALSFFAPEIEINEFPAWDCLPYDRVSPHAGVVAQRMTTLSRLARLQGRERPGVVLTTVNAALQRVPSRGLIAAQALSAAPGNMLAMDGVTKWLELNGYNVLPGDAGRKAVFVSYSPVIITTVFPTEAKTVEEAEAELTDDADRLLSRRQNANTVLITEEQQCRQL